MVAPALEPVDVVLPRSAAAGTPGSPPPGCRSRRRRRTGRSARASAPRRRRRRARRSPAPRRGGRWSRRRRRRPAAARSVLLVSLMSPRRVAAGVAGAGVDARQVDHAASLGSRLGDVRTGALRSLEWRDVGSFRVVSEGPLTRPLSGTVHVGGAKNSALKLMAAALLAPGRSVIHNVPEHPRRRGDGPAAAPARLHGRDRLPRRRRPDPRADVRAGHDRRAGGARPQGPLRARTPPPGIDRRAGPARRPLPPRQRGPARRRRDRLARPGHAHPRAAGARCRRTHRARAGRRRGARRAARRQPLARLPLRRGDREPRDGGGAGAGHDASSTTSPASPRSSTCARCWSRWARRSTGSPPRRWSSRASSGCTRSSTRTVTDRIVAGTWVFASAIAGGDLHIERRRGPPPRHRARQAGRRRAPRSSRARPASRCSTHKRLHVLRRRDAALPGLPDRPAAVRDGAGRRSPRAPR